MNKKEAIQKYAFIFALAASYQTKTLKNETAQFDEIAAYNALFNDSDESSPNILKPDLPTILAVSEKFELNLNLHGIQASEFNPIQQA